MLNPLLACSGAPHNLPVSKPATDVDHVIPHRGNERLFWNEQNWQALCYECHSQKTASGM